MWKTTRSDSSARQIAALPPRVATAILIAWPASSASGCSPVAAPRSRREYRSITVARYSLPWSVGISVMSPTQRQFGAAAVKFRLSRSGNFGAVLSCRVSPLRRLIRLATRPWRAIESATVFSEIVRVYEKQKEHGKQVFLVYDTLASYDAGAQRILEKNAVLRLSPAGNELVGWAWNKEEKNDADETS